MNFPPCYLKAGVSHLKLSQEKKDILKLFLDEFRGNMLFIGDPGRGKTYAACACGNYIPFHFPEIDPTFINISDLNQEWLANLSDHAENGYLLDQLKEYSFLIIDDLGIRKPSDGFMDFLYSLINHRTENPKFWTIYTTNLKSKELNEIYGSRIISRIFSGDQIIFDGEDQRMESAKKRKEINKRESELKSLFKNQNQSNL